MAEPYSKPQNDLPPPLPHEPDEFNVPTVQSDPPGYRPPAPAAKPAAPTPPVTFTPPAAQPRPAAAQPAQSVPSPAAEQVAPPPATPPAPRPPKRGLRSLFWPGFVAGFMLLAGMSCGGAVVATGISRINLADLQDPGSSWSPPPVTPTPLVSDQSAPDGEAQGSGEVHPAGNVVRNITSSNVNIRATPGYLSKPDGDVVAQVRPGETVEILGERTQADNLVWWRIRYQSSGGGVVEGWVAEATASGVQILGQ